MTKPVLALSLAALAVFGWSLPVAHSAPPAASAPAGEPVAIEVDVDELPEAERAIASVVLEHMRGLVEGGGYEVAQDAETVLRVRLRQLEAGDRNYGIHFEFVEGAVAESAVEWTDCVFCTEARLLQKLDAAQGEVLGAIAERQRGAVGDDGGGEDGGGETTGGEETGGEEGGDGDVGEPVKPIGALGGAGIGVAVVGIGATIGGAVELSRGRVYDDGAETNDQRTGTDHRPPGYALIGIGAAAAIAGVVILAVDLSQRAKQRKQTQRAQAIIVPSLTSIGVGVVGRF